MGINVKATERNVSFEKNKEKWAYVMMPETYSTLAASKVIDEASIRSGIPKGSLNASWAAIGDVVSAWTTEGHSVAIPGLGYIRFGIRSTSGTTGDRYIGSQNINIDYGLGSLHTCPLYRRPLYRQNRVDEQRLERKETY